MTYQRGGFAALTPKVRADKGQPRTLSAPQQKWILEQAQAHLAVPVKVLYRRWREQDPQLPSLNSLYRFLREHELHTKARRAQLRQPLGGATKCFEAPFVNDLWMTDFSPGPYLHPAEGGKAVPTFLCVIIDDHSRLIPYAAYFLRADTQAFHPNPQGSAAPPRLARQTLHRSRRPFHQRPYPGRVRQPGHPPPPRQTLSRLVEGKSRAGDLHHPTGF